METINVYLQNMFSAFPDTPEVRRAKENFLENMEDKYHALKAEGKSENEAVGIVISEFGNIQEIAEELGLEKTEIPPKAVEEEVTHAPLVSAKEAQEYLEIKNKFGSLVASGVSLCILSPIIFIFGDALGTSYMTDGIFHIFFFSIIALAVAIFILSGVKMSQYDYMESPIALDSDTKAQLEAEYKNFIPKFAKIIAFGVVLCILSPVVLIWNTQDGVNTTMMVEMYSIALLLFMVAIGVFLFVRFGNLHSAYHCLLEIGDYTIEKKKNSKFLNAVSSIIWLLAVGIFLFWSFVLGGWKIAWVVFPITAVLYEAFCALYHVLKTKK